MLKSNSLIAFSCVFMSLTAGAAWAAGGDAAKTSEAVSDTAFLSTSNLAGIMQYCAKEGHAKAEIVKAYADILEKAKPADGDLSVAAKEAEEVGKRGVMFTFAKKGEKRELPSVTLETLALQEKTTILALCDRLGKTVTP